MSVHDRTIDYGDRGSVRVVADGAALAQAAAETMISAATSAVAARGVAFIALSGGSTPKAMGTLLSTDGFRSRMPWQATEFFWGDERWVPISSPESNAGEAIRGYLASVGVPETRIHPAPTDNSDPATAALAYEETIRSIVPAANGLPTFDLVLLGMGEDGHTASLFPNTAALQETERLVVHNEVPQLTATRITMTAPLINAGRQVVFLAGGGGKAARLSEVLDGAIDTQRLPSQMIRPSAGPLWLVDEAAAAQLQRNRS